MDISTLVQYLDDPQAARGWIESLGIEDTQRAHANLVALTESGLTLDLLAMLCDELADRLPRSSDPDRALNNLDRFFFAARNPLSLGSLFERDRDALATLLQIFSTSQYLSDLLVQDPESFDLLRLTEGQPVARDVLVAEIVSEVAMASDDRAVMSILRRYKRRETLRIAYGDIIRGHRIEVVTKQISFLADAICEAALRAAWSKLSEQRGEPRLADGHTARFTILGLGKLGGSELNYSSDIDLIFISEGDGKTDGARSSTNQEFFDRLAQLIVRFLSENTDMGSAYRVDLRLRPDGGQGAAVITRDAAVRYYDAYGRTWERQALVKARPVAGDRDLGNDLLQRLAPWIYRRYLGAAEIAEIKALKRRIETTAKRGGVDTRNIKTGHGGIRDIEFVIQFLQLLNGGDLPEIRTGNTLQAIQRLESCGCLTMQERSLLADNYEFLRKIEHRLQIMFDLQTHALPESEAELRRLAMRMGIADSAAKPALAAFRQELQNRTALNRRILDHLLHDAFVDDGRAEPEVDLVLDPHPSDELIEATLGRFGFADVRAAYDNLMSLAREPIPFLSARRCRHFLAAIAARLLRAIGDTPDPDATLVNLSKVSDSLGGKGLLWELFSFHTPSLQLYVRLCACSPYLSGILMSNPGMIDELLDSLMLRTLPSREVLAEILEELCRRAEDVEPILHSFKDAQHLRVGVRDVMGKEDVRTTHRTLADIAEACLRQIAGAEERRLRERFGVPIQETRRETEEADNDGDTEDAETAQRPTDEAVGQPCELVILALGKLGGREPNYHSDLDVVFVYEACGQTRHERPSRRSTTSNQHFFSQLGQRLIKRMTEMGPYGRLYELDPRLRPTGRSGALAVALDEFERYFLEGQGQLWERQALCKARPVYGSDRACERVMRVVRNCILTPPWKPEDAQAIHQMRLRLEETATPRNLKRGPGGTVDIEFLTQMLQLQHAREFPQVLQPGTLDALDALGEAGCLESEDTEFLRNSYRFLRSVEARLRLMNTAARHDFPEDEGDLRKLAYLMDQGSHRDLEAQCRHFREENRRRFERLIAAAAGDVPRVGRSDSA